MSTRATMWFNAKEGVHLYREMSEDSYWLETPKYKVCIPKSLGKCLEYIRIPDSVTIRRSKK